jgi:hypothetical protein
MHGNVVMDLRDFQDTPHRMASGIWNVGGGAYDPATPPELLNRARRTINQPLNPWLEERERLLGPYRLPLRTQPDIHGKYRVQGNCVRNGVDCPLQPIHARPGGHIYTHPPDNGHRLPICQGKTVQLGRDNFLIPKAKSKGHIPTYQPLPYGTYEHAAVYHSWRSRTEGLLGTLTEHHGMWGGRHGFKVRNFDILQLFTIAAGIAYNLRRQGHFAPDHGTTTATTNPCSSSPNPTPSRSPAPSSPVSASATPSTRPPARPTTIPPPPATSPRRPPTHPPASPDTRPCAVGQHPCPPA